MGGPATTGVQLGAQRYLTRRLERALLRGDLQPGPDPRRALVAGVAVTVLGLAGSTLLAVGWPRPTLDDAPILLARESGALYVRVGDVLHPVPNLASARLIAGPVDPRPVRDADLARAARGPALGIAGAPGALGAVLPATITWSVCDQPAATTVAVDADVPDPGRIDPQQAVPVTAGETTFVIHRGRRIAVDRAGVLPRRVSPLLLNAIPEAPPGELPGRIAAPPDDPVLCVHWIRRPDGGTEVALTSGAALPLPDGRTPVALAQADGDGPALDAVSLPPGSCGYLRSGLGDRYLVVDTGVRYPIGDDDAARALGLPDAAATAPWPVLAGLPSGPELSRRQALTARDGIGPR